MLTKTDEQKMRKMIENDIPELKADAAYARQHIDMLHRDVEVLRQDVEEIKRDVAQLKEDVAVLKRDVAEIREDIDVIKEILTVLLERTANWGKIQTDVKRQGDDIDLLKLMTRDHTEEIAWMKRQRAF